MEDAAWTPEPLRGWTGGRGSSLVGTLLTFKATAGQTGRPLHVQPEDEPPPSTSETANPCRLRRDPSCASPPVPSTLPG